ncbi:MAG: hypothetical protein GY757_56795, partial [bacterium]|nr:hypothetical protein [bacterium]
MQHDSYRDAQRVYGWSFYSQGAKEGSQVSADAFMMKALAWFGDPDPKAGDAAARGKRLARLLGQKKSLLLLDGLEPLQFPPGKHGLGGKLKDQGLLCLLKALSASNLPASKRGLCLITSREKV